MKEAFVVMILMERETRKQVSKNENYKKGNTSKIYEEKILIDIIWEALKETDTTRT
jgi:hypothetical protein